MAHPADDPWRPPEQPERPSDPARRSPRGPDRPEPGRDPGAGGPRGATARPRWLPWILAAVAFLAVVMWFNRPDSGPDRVEITYSQFRELADDDKVERIHYDQSDGRIDGEFREDATVIVDGEVVTEDHFRTQGPTNALPEDDNRLLDRRGVSIDYERPSDNFLGTLLIFLLPVSLLIAFFWFMSRRAQGQMGQVMNIGRSKAKVYSTEKPRTSFADVAGYHQVKQEITEVVDFLRHGGKFRDIGARVPKGVLLVGPPGTGKTLIARAVAGEAGVPFLSVTGSDFMEMFVGVGASRVRDLFQTARKEAPAIIFVDEIDSIGRKRGAGLGGGHDEREQTLNQILSEMDGFDPTEGVIVMAATNRPDVLDPALLRPGRFDRQVTIPLPTQEERAEILEVHFRDKRIASDVDAATLARGTPGMAGADLANLVNEAALFAVRRNVSEIHAEDFEAARDRVMMGMRRSLALSEEEKEVVAYHESGHALTAYVLEHADPLHKVTILPTGMALGVTQQLPAEERHIYKLEYIADSLVVRLGGRVAERIIYGHLSTGAQNDLVGCTELARKMVREWGMSERIGPMAWGSSGPVFLGEDLTHTRDYSDETARVIDEEVERILREEEERCHAVLIEHRGALEALATRLIESESLTGDEVAQIVDDAMGYPAGGPRKVVAADGTEDPDPTPLEDPVPPVPAPSSGD